MELHSIEASTLLNHPDVFDSTCRPQADVVDLGQAPRLSIDLIGIGGEVVGADELGQAVLEEVEVEGVVEVGIVEPRHGVHVIVGAESIDVLLTRGRYSGMEGK